MLFVKCRSYLFFGDNKVAIEKEKLQGLKTAKLKIPRGRKSELVVSCQVVINPFCGLSVIFCGFISHLIGRETINIPEIFSGVHGFTGKTVITHPSGEINLQSKQDIVSHVAKVKPTTSAHYVAGVIPFLAYIIFPSNPTLR